MSRRRRRAPWFVWLRCAGPVRLLRVQAGDTLIVSLPDTHFSATHADDIRRQLEDAVGLGADIEVITLPASVGLTTLRTGAL